jgi:hypothetical protein
MLKLSSFIILLIITACHNTFAKCFISSDITNSSKLFSYKGKVYDITGYSHPGGKSDLLKTVGEQLETYVNTNNYDFHLSSSKFKSDLKNMYVGDLVDNCTTTETPTTTTTDKTTSTADTTTTDTTKTTTDTTTTDTTTTDTTTTDTTTTDTTKTTTTESPITTTTESPPYNCIPFDFNPLSLLNPNIIIDNAVQTYNGVKLSLTQNGGASIKIDNKFQYGVLDAFFKASNGIHVISSFYIESENKDQVIFNVHNDNDENSIETNFFYEGNMVNVKYNYPTELLSETYNKYTIVWFPDYYEWRFNDLILRRMNKNDTDTFPDAPSSIKFSIWTGTSGIQWDEAPFEYYISSVQLRCPDAFISNNSIFYDDRNMNNKMKSGGSGNKLPIILLLITLLISV